MWKYLALGAAYAFAAAVQPGPFQSYLLSATVRRGWRRTLPACFAPLVSDAPILLVCLFVLSRIPGDLTRILHLAGAAFLLYLAFGAWRSWRRSPEEQPPHPGSGGRTLFSAALVNFLNPNPWIGWSLVMGPLLLEGWRESPSHGVALLVGFYGTMVVSLAGIVALFGLARSLGPRVARTLLGISVLALAGFGIYQLWLGLAAGASP